ncbi:hypothetical protein NKH18_05120 [Streptomyces sp. M10(2022)]
MSERSGTTWVAGTTGPLHNGTGDMYVTIGADQQGSGRPYFTRFADDQLAWLRRVLVAPPGMGKARSELADTGTVILDGLPGSGRTCAARVLLREHHTDMGTFRELLPDEEGELPSRTRSWSEQATGCCWICRLPTLSGGPPPGRPLRPP